MPESERRPLSVLFAELTARTELAATLDPEDLRLVLLQFHRIARQVVSRTGGFVAEYLGDGVVAYFGYPHASEEDAGRAVHSGLAMIDRVGTDATLQPERVGVEIGVRVAVHSGPTVIEPLEPGGPPRAIGHTLNVAARLQGVAAMNSLVASADTVGALREPFAMELLGALTLKGCSEPVRTFRIRAPSAIERAIQRAEADAGRLFDRDAELALLRRAFAGVEARTGRVVLVVGEAGLGKSQLIRSFRAELGPTFEHWYSASCTAYDRDSAFRSVLQIAAQLPESWLTPLRGGASGKADTPDAAAFLASLLGDGSGAGFPTRLGPRAHEALVASMAELFLRVTERGPAVLVFEDIHWADASTLRVLRTLIERAERHPLLILVTQRPGSEPPWDGLPHIRKLELGPLSVESLMRLIRSVDRAHWLSDATVRALAERASGVPLFAEELAKSYCEPALPGTRSGVSVVDPIPATLQTLLMSRLDRLGSGKRLAQLAAVLGREFDREELREFWEGDGETFERTFEQLLAAQLWTRCDASEDSRPPRWRFRHALLQEAAYDSVPLRERRNAHARIGRHLAESRPRESAHHYDRAQSFAAAIERYQRAAELATRKSADDEARAQLRRALELLEHLPPSIERDGIEVDLCVALGSACLRVHGPGSSEVEAAFRRARRLCEGAAWAPAGFSAIAGLVIFYQNRSELELAFELCQQLRAMARESGDAAELLSSHYLLGVTYFWRGEFVRAVSHFEQCTTMYLASAHAELAFVYGTDPAVESYAYGALALVALGRLYEARQWNRRALDAAARLDHAFSTASAEGYTSVFEWLLGAGRSALAHAERCADVASRGGFPKWEGIAACMRVLARARVDVRCIEEAEIETAISVARSTMGAEGSLLGVPTLLAAIAELHLERGSIANGAHLMEQAVATHRTLGQGNWSAELRRLQGVFAAKRGPANTEQTREHLRAAVSIARIQGARIFELRALVALCGYERTGLEPEPDMVALRRLLAEIQGGELSIDVESARRYLEGLGACDAAGDAD